MEILKIINQLSVIIINWKEIQKNSEFLFCFGVLHMIIFTMYLLVFCFDKYKKIFSF